MKNQNKVDWVNVVSLMLLAISLGVIWYMSKSTKPQIIKVLAPEVIGAFKPQKPTTLKETDTLYLANPIDEKLITENDSLKMLYINSKPAVRDSICNELIKLKPITSTFENDTIKIDVNGVVQGEIKQIALTYKIKAKTIEVQVIPKETVLRVLSGIEIGNTTQLNNFKVKANLMLQSRKGNVYSGSYDINKTIWIGCNWSIFDFKK